MVPGSVSAGLHDGSSLISYLLVPAGEKAQCYSSTKHSGLNNAFEGDGFKCEIFQDHGEMETMENS